MKRISEYDNITTIAETDVVPIVDVSDTEQASTGSTRKGTIATIADYLKDRAETLTNKILTTARLNTPKINEDVTVTATSTELNKLDGLIGGAVGTTDTQTLTNKTIDGKNNTITNTTPAGVVEMFAGSTAPTGYLLCDGSAVSRTTYSALFTVISTTYGAGDGSTTFNLPNVKGKVAVGYNSAEAEFNALGKTGGEKAHTLTVAEMPSHSHTIWTLNQQIGTGSDPLLKGTYNSVKDTGSGSSGGGGAHNNLQPYIVLNYIIKT